MFPGLRPCLDAFLVPQETHGISPNILILAVRPIVPPKSAGIERRGLRVCLSTYLPRYLLGTEHVVITGSPAVPSGPSPPCTCCARWRGMA